MTNDGRAETTRPGQRDFSNTSLSGIGSVCSRLTDHTVVIVRLLCSLLSILLLSSPARSQPVSADSARMLASQMEVVMIELLDAFYPRAVDSVHGGFFSEFDADWRLTPNQDKLIVTQARHIWTASEASLFFPDRQVFLLDVAGHGFRFLRDKMWDREHGGFISRVTQEGELKRGPDNFTIGKTAYGNAFAIYGVAAYYEASGDPEALSLAQNAFGWLDASAHDAVHGGYFQFFSDDGIPSTEGRGDHPAKDQNSSIHLLEALTQLYRVWPDSVVRARLEEMLTVVRDTIASPDGYLRLFFDRSWHPVTYRDSSETVQRAHLHLDHISYGHDIETAFLMDEAARVLGLTDDRSIRQGKVMVDHALDYGWDDEMGGFVDGGYYFDKEGPPETVIPIKTWWVEAEGLNALLLMAERFPGDQRAYWDYFVRQWRFIGKYVVDRVRGGWYWGGLDRDPDRRDYLKAHMWKGPYHDGRALMSCMTKLRAWHN